MRGVVAAQWVDRFETAPALFFPSLKHIIIGARCSWAHHDTAWISFSASGASRDEYILTGSDRHTQLWHARAGARASPTKHRESLEMEAPLWSLPAVYCVAIFPSILWVRVCLWGRERESQRERERECERDHKLLSELELCNCKQ